ncbi:LLM class flavin-dependent oxidoreductase [Galbitalea sp. SE-J8]|uniref:LLM class flavin-dependent oxidoreductase n=1 Tax=Galbitalea sp. SE-J8 TaxID=3054952 RepID=UPI00259C6B1D|nr:LLM class flavin-dependent oxidoreductase [Galbitalea sp. SE-J8]MDM4763362.1 LLM class flavin-dependent oxidoreductase [Galbitalea sp. SE-J8]
MSRLQHFGWFLSRGFGPHGWARDYREWNWDWTRPDLYQQSIRELERAGFDLVIIEDALSLGNPSTLDLRVREAYGAPKHDPLLLAPYLFDATERIGVAVTTNPLAYHPYTAARQFATLGHLSGHRFGANVVTDVGSSRHFGVDPLPHDRAYDRAQEWLDGIRSLWSSWRPGALVRDAATDRFADGSLLDAVQHRGEFYRFDGPLNALPADDDPFIVSPGGSPRGIAFAGANSDVQLALASFDLGKLRGYRERVREQAVLHGRDPDHVKTLIVFKPTIVGSPEEARRLVDASQHPDDAALLAVAKAWSSDSETDLTALDLDRPLDPGVFGDHVSQGTIKGLLGGSEFGDGTPLRELLARKARLGRVADRTGVVGTADEIADFIEELGAEADNDGLIFSGDLHPVTIHRTLDDLVPILRRRGILRDDLGTGGTRANLRDF